MAKVCDQCSLPFKGFGTTCSNCRKAETSRRFPTSSVAAQCKSSRHGVKVHFGLAGAEMIHIPLAGNSSVAGLKQAVEKQCQVPARFLKVLRDYDVDELLDDATLDSLCLGECTVITTAYTARRIFHEVPHARSEHLIEEEQHDIVADFRRLGLIPKCQPAAVAALLQALQGQRCRVKQQIALALGEVAKKGDSDVVQALSTFLKQASGQEAMGGDLGFINAQWQSPLSTGPWVLCAAALALERVAEQNDPMAIEALQAALTKNFPHNREASLRIVERALRTLRGDVVPSLAEPA